MVFVAELGDKSQLLAMTLASRRPAVPVLVGVAIAATVLQGLAALVGATLASAVPGRLVAVVAAVGFLLAAVLTLRSDDEEQVSVRTARSTVLMAAGSLLLAELGDKTMFATAALAVREQPWLTWIGGTTGMVLADALAVALGATLLRRLPTRALRWGTAAVFAAVGLAVLVAGLVAG